MSKKNNPDTRSEEARRLSAIFQDSRDGIITINRGGVVESINPAAAQLFGYTPEEVINQNIKMLMPEPYRSAHDGYIDNYNHTGKKKIIGIGREVKGKRKDDTIFPLFLSVSEVQLDDRKIFTGFIHDLTLYEKKEKEIKELNQKLERKVIDRTNELSQTVDKLLTTNKKLEFEINERKKVEAALRQSEIEILHALANEKELGELKSRFVSMASHEFRTPLSTILSSASLIGKYQESGQQEKRDKHIERIKSAVGNLTGILNDFLSLSKLEEGKIKNNPEVFELNTFCQEVIEEIEGLLKKGQKVHYQESEKNQNMYLDKRLLKNVLFNLLSNAIKYSSENKTIYCGCTIDGKQMEVSVRDEGMGIPKEDQPYLFSRFFRASNASNIQGTGLGLNIVKNYVALMGGTIEYESIENVGSTFTIQLPIKANKNEKNSNH